MRKLISSTSQAANHVDDLYTEYGFLIWSAESCMLPSDLISHRQSATMSSSHAPRARRSGGNDMQITFKGTSVTSRGELIEMHVNGIRE